MSDEERRARKAEQRQRKRSKLSASSRRISDEALRDMTTDEIRDAYERGLLGAERWYAAASSWLELDEVEAFERGELRTAPSCYGRYRDAWPPKRHMGVGAKGPPKKVADTRPPGVERRKERAGAEAAVARARDADRARAAVAGTVTAARGREAARASARNPKDKPA